MGNYRDLKVYQKSYEAAKRIYTIVRTFPQQEQYGLISQMKRAATGIPLNIAEGSGKKAGDREMVCFLKMAKGSVAEMEVLLDFSYDFGYITKAEHEEYGKRYEEIGKMLSGMVNSLEKGGTTD